VRCDIDCGAILLDHRVGTFTGWRQSVQTCCAPWPCIPATDDAKPVSFPHMVTIWSWKWLAIGTAGDRQRRRRFLQQSADVKRTMFGEWFSLNDGSNDIQPHKISAASTARNQPSDLDSLVTINNQLASVATPKTTQPGNRRRQLSTSSHYWPQKARFNDIFEWLHRPYIVYELRIEK